MIAHELLPQVRLDTWRSAGMQVRAAGAGAPLLLLHGGTGSWMHWVRNIEALAARFRVIVPDLPGMGESADVPEGARLEEYLPYVLAGFDDGLVPRGQRFGVAGFSFGGLLAAAIAARLPERTAGACLLCPGGFPPGASRRPPLRRVPADASAREAEAIHRGNIELLLIGDPDRVEAFAVAMQQWNHAHARYKSRRIGYGDHLARYLPDARCPLLAILGRNDPLPLPDNDARAAYLASLSPRMHTAIVEDAGHWVAYERPEETNRLMNGFFQTCLPTR